MFNNGILGYVDFLDDEHKISGNCLAVGMMGMKFFYMAHDFYAGQFTKSVYPEFEGFDEDIAQWFISWFNKSSDKYLSVLVRDFEKEFDDTVIDIPYKNGKICISYIKDTIEEIKRYETEKLSLFFEANGYSDCTLTEEERRALVVMESGNIQMMDRTIKDIFSVLKGKRLTKDNMIPGTTNFIGASATENGITNRISNNKHIHSGNKITVTYNGSVGESFYQPFPFWASDDVNVLYPNEELSESQCLYFIAPLRKKGKRYGYAFKWAKEIMEQDTISVPVKSDGTIDYNFMETFINALKKQCIARLKASDVFAQSSAYRKDVLVEEDDDIEPPILDASNIPISDRFSTHLPVYPLRAACGYFDECGKLQEEYADGWVDAHSIGHRLNENMFVIYAEGDSMEPKIHNGDLCVFDASGAGSREGKIVLTKAKDRRDSNASSFTIKKYHSEKVVSEDGSWTHSQITLSPLNLDYNPIIINAEDADEGDFRIYGEFICTLNK